MNILFLTINRTDACSFYRAGGLVKDLRRKTLHNITCLQWNEIAIHWQVLLDFDLIMMQRPSSKEALDLCSYIKGMNIPLWLDFDDDLLNIPPENKAHLLYDEPEVKESIKKMLRIADAITVTNEDLKISFAQYNKNITIIPNAFNDSVFNRTFIRKRADLVAWRGSDTHIYDLMSMGGALNKLTDEFPAMQFLFLGYYPWFLNKSDNKFFLKDMDIIIYFNTLYKMAPLVMQVPLHDDPFNRCKSNIAFIEGSYFGAICVVPDWWTLPGSLPYSDTPGFYEAIRSVLAGEIDIEAQNKIAWEYINDNLLLSKVNEKRIEVINSLL